MIELQKIKNLYFIFIFIFWIGGATKLLESDLFLTITFIISLSLYIKTKKRLKLTYIVILLLFLLINIVSIFISGDGLNYLTLVGYLMRISIAYFTLEYLGWDFFSYYRKAIFIMALISIPFFIVQLFNANFFIRNLPSINMSGELRTSVDYWNFFIYTAHQGRYNGIIRNSGFAIEPGHFGYLLGFGLILESIKTGFKINTHIIVLIIVGLSTFSTTFYIFLALFLLYFQFNTEKRTKYLFIKFALVISLVVALVSSGVVTEKVELTLRDNQASMTRNYSDFESGDILNRFGMLEVGWSNFLTNPLGHGVNSNGLIKDDFNEVLAGPNTFVWLTINWGFLFLLFMPYSLNFFFRKIMPNIGKYSRYLLLAIFILWLNSSMQSRDLLFFVIFLAGIIKIHPAMDFKTMLNT